MLHLAQKAFAPGKLPFPLLHVDTTWKFREMIAFRDKTAARLGLALLVHVNQDGVRRGISPIASGSAVHTLVMRTEALRGALEKWKFDLAFGGARRDEERSRAKERIFSLRTAAHTWDPRNQRLELWKLFTHAFGLVNRCASSHSQTGLNSMCGNTSGPRTYLSSFISQSRDRWSSAMVC